MKILSGFIFLVILSGFTGDGNYMVKPGIGTDQFMVGKTTVHQVFEILGKNDSFCRRPLHTKDNASQFLFVYRRLGLSFMIVGTESALHDENTLITTFGFKEPAKAATPEGVRIGIDTEKEVVAAYGAPRLKTLPMDGIYNLHYDPLGISFTLDDLTRRVQKIEVYKPLRLSSK